MFEFLVAYTPYFVSLGNNTITKRASRNPYQTLSKSRAIGDLKEEEASSSKKEETSSAEEEEEDPFYQNEDDCFGICLD